MSPKSIIPKTAQLQIESKTPSSEQDYDRDASASVTSRNSSLIPVALVPRYQLTTADAHACATPINDAYAPLDHWQWMASLWRGCVGPDITVYVRECEKEELEKHGGSGGGMPVENRLHDAKTLVVRKGLDSSTAQIEEKALRRIGFEVEECLRK